MDSIITWVNENKEWLFSGLGITAMTLVLAGLRRIFHKKKEENNSETAIKQINYGTKSTQIGFQNNYYTKGKDDE